MDYLKPSRIATPLDFLFKISDICPAVVSDFPVDFKEKGGENENQDKNQSSSTASLDPSQKHEGL